MKKNVHCMSAPFIKWPFFKKLYVKKLRSTGAFSIQFVLNAQSKALFNSKLLYNIYVCLSMLVNSIWLAKDLDRYFYPILDIWACKPNIMWEQCLLLTLNQVNIGEISTNCFGVSGLQPDNNIYIWMYLETCSGGGGGPHWV